MKSRTRFLITAAFVCHLLAAPALVTSQLLANSATSPPATAEADKNSLSVLKNENVTISALRYEKDGPIYKLHGNAEVHYGIYVLRADDMTYNSDTGDATLDGGVRLDGGPNDEHLEASHGSYNVENETGHFDNVRGGIGLKLRESHYLLTSANPFSFTGKRVEKTGPDHFIVYDGTVTTCELPNPKWQFNAHKVVVEARGNARIYHTSFRLHGIPVLYFPFATHPVERLPRQSGFLIPNLGNSSIKGTILGESLFLKINRSVDATVGAEYFSSRGWSPQGGFRARPSDTSFIDMNYFSVLDRRTGANYQGGVDVRLIAEGAFAHNLRGVANLDYLSSFVFRLAFNEVFTQAVNSEVKSRAFLSNTTNGFFSNVSAERYQNYENDTLPLQVVTIAHAPSFEFSTVDRQIGHSPLYWSYNAAAEGLSRTEPGFGTASLIGRFDLNPSMSLPLHFQGWSLRPELSLRDTLYTQRLIPAASGAITGTATSDLISRKALEGSVDLRLPTLSRVFDRGPMRRKWKHVIEPRVVYNYVTGVNNFANILRFDERDILSDTNEVEYSIVNRLYSKRTSSGTEDCGPPGMPSLFIGGAAPPDRVPWERQEDAKEAPCASGPQVREVLTWELSQKYFLDPTFGGALVPGRRNVFTTTADLTGIAFLTEARRLSPLVSRLRIQTSSRTDIEWNIDYDFRQDRVNDSTAFLNYRIGPMTLGGGDAFLQAPGETLVSPALLSAKPSPEIFNQFRVLLGYGSPNKRGLSGATNLGFDANLGFLQYASAQLSYNWDCCGANVEYRRFALGSVRNENQFRFTFALAKIGAFGNLRRQERLF